MWGDFQSFYLSVLSQKKRGGLGSSAALGNSSEKATQGVVLFVASGSTRMVGIRPILGLPTEPWALAMRRVDSEVVPQQSFFGQ